MPASVDGRGELGEIPVSVRHIVLEVPGARILDGVDLDVASGQIVAVMGMSGSGKTSLLKCIAGLQKPTSGEIRIAGRDIVPLPESELDQVRLRIGLVFQYAALFDSLTVRENVAFGLVYGRKMAPADTEPIVHRMLAEVGLEGTEAMYPSQLSGGMQKRVGLARSLALEPSILLYDEPTSGLDPVIGRHIDDLIVETRDRTGVASVVVSHDVDSVLRIADEVAMLHQGAVVAAGTPEEMRMSANPIVQEFIGGDRRPQR